ncbi:ABC transporter permease subunit, partial [Lactiplantibacillus plantarum]
MHYILEILPSLLSGAVMTLKIFIWTLIGSLPLGLVVGLGMMTNFKPLQWLLHLYVWLMRGTPLLLQLI